MSLHTDFKQYGNLSSDGTPLCLLFGLDPTHSATLAAHRIIQRIVSDISRSDQQQQEQRVHYFYLDRNSENDNASNRRKVIELARLMAVDLQAEQPPQPFSLNIVEPHTNVKYRYQGPPDDVAIRSWLEAFHAGRLSPFALSAPRPAGDRDPLHAGVTVVTADSFRQLVQDCPHDVLLFVTVPYSYPKGLAGAGALRWLYALADHIAARRADSSQLTPVATAAPPPMILASLDAHLNDVPDCVLSIPSVLLFPLINRQKADEDKAVELEEPTAVADWLPFLQRHLPHWLSPTERQALTSSSAMKAAEAFSSLLMSAQETVMRCRPLIALLESQQRIRPSDVDGINAAKAAVDASMLRLTTANQARAGHTEQEEGELKETISRLEALLDDITAAAGCTGRIV